MYIAKKADEDLLCEKGDEICNAVHNVIIAVAKKTDIDSAIQEAIDSLACTKFHASPEDKTRIIQYVRKHLKDMRFENGEPEWDMHYIGDLIVVFEVIFEEYLLLFHFRPFYYTLYFTKKQISRTMFL